MVTSAGAGKQLNIIATAERIDADIKGKLHIESVQDTLSQQSQQSGGGIRVQVSLGTAWEAGGNFSQNQGSGEYRSVSQQSGLFAGDGSYHVKADSVHLKGGAIASNAAKENNELTAGSLTWENIKNRSSYSASGVSLSGGYQNGSPDFAPGLPQYQSDSGQSTTYATLSEGRLNIGGKQTSTEALGIHNEAAGAHQSLSELPDIRRVMEQQQTVAKATADIAAAVKTFSGNMAEQKEQEKTQAAAAYENRLKERNDGSYERFIAQDADSRHLQMLADDSAYAAADSGSRDWGIGGANSRALNAATTLITGALGGQTDLQVAANTLAPYAAAAIGQQVGHGENKNEVAQAVGHFVLGATLAYINGGDPLSGGGAAVAAETAAQYLARQYDDGQTARDPVTGEFNPNLLPESVKEEIRATTGVIASIVGATGDGGAALNAQIGGVIGQNAVENNDLYGGKAFAEQFSCRNKSSAECQRLQTAYREADLKAAAVITPIADEVGRFFLMPYDLTRGLSEAKTGGEAVTAIVLALPPAKIYDKARDLVRAGKNLDALNELKRLKDVFTQNPSLAAANGIEVPGIAMAAKQHGGGSAGRNATATGSSKYTGGAHSETSKPANDGLDSHHCPAKNCYQGAPISNEQGPAIKMEPSDHAKTASYGNSKEAREYRLIQQKLLQEGKLQEAIEMDVKDIRSKFGSKYDKAINQMLDYSKTLDPNSFKIKK